jgi:hypothetical protein
LFLFAASNRQALRAAAVRILTVRQLLYGLYTEPQGYSQDIQMGCPKDHRQDSSCPGSQYVISSFLLVSTGEINRCPRDLRS